MSNIEHTLKYSDLSRLVAATPQIETAHYLAVLKLTKMINPVIEGNTVSPGLWTGMMLIVRKRDSSIACQVRLVARIERKKTTVFKGNSRGTVGSQVKDVLLKNVRDKSLTAIDEISDVLSPFGSRTGQ